MKIYFKRNGRGYISGCSVNFGSREMKDLQLVDENGCLKEIKSAKVLAENLLLIELK